jgi:hypothetical protein
LSTFKSQRIFCKHFLFFVVLAFFVMNQGICFAKLMLFYRQVLLRWLWTIGTAVMSEQGEVSREQEAGSGKSVETVSSGE